MTSDLTVEQLDELPFQPKPPPLGFLSCDTCKGIGAVPIRKTDPESGEYLEERYPNHAHGSETCPACGGPGYVKAKEET
jgi:hypothetical protein